MEENNKVLWQLSKGRYEESFVSKGNKIDAVAAIVHSSVIVAVILRIHWLVKVANQRQASDDEPCRPKEGAITNCAVALTSLTENISLEIP